MAAERQRTSGGFNSDHQYTEATVSQIQSVPSPTNNSLMKKAPTPLSVQNTQAVSGPRLGLMGPPASNVPLSGQRFAVQQPQFQEAGQSTAQLGSVISGSGNNPSDVVQPVINIFNPTSQTPAARQPAAYQPYAYQPGSIGGTQGVSGGTATLFSPQQHNPFGGQTYTGYSSGSGPGFSGFAINSASQLTAPQDLSPANQFAQMIQMLSSGFNSTQQPSSRDPETRMARALEELRANPVQVPAGIDDRFENLHIGRFLGGAVTNQQRKWLIARELYGLSGITPLTGYDLDTIGIAGCVTTKGILEIQNPANPHMKLKYFSSTNVGSAALSSRRLTLAEGDHAVDINESLRDLVHMADFTMALTNVSKVMSIVLDWNHSVNALEIFLVNSSYCADKTAHLPDRAAELTAFVDHVFHANSRRWVNFQPFLDASTLPAAFLSWFGSRPSGRIIPVATVPVAAEPKGDSKAAKRRNRGNRGSGGGGNNFGGGYGGGYGHGGGSSGSSGGSGGRSGGNKNSNSKAGLCRRYNQGFCRNSANNCTDGSGKKLAHLCSHESSIDGKICRGSHPESRH
jgi:uncharacterized membrane protein YgcG